MRRIVIIGTTGAGKSTLGDRLQTRLNISHVEIDSLSWEPGWKMAPRDVLRSRVAQITDGSQWILSGNYRELRDLTWARADTLIWLDYPLWLVWYRLLKRTVRRIVTHENLWGHGLYETWRTQFFSRDSLLLYAFKSYRKQHREFPPALQQPEYAHLTVIRHYLPRETDRWLNGITPQKSGVMLQNER